MGLLEQRTKGELTYGSQLSQQLGPHTDDDLHGSLGQEVLLAEGPLPAVATRLLPRLRPRIMGEKNKK